MSGHRHPDICPYCRAPVSEAQRKAIESEPVKTHRSVSPSTYYVHTYDVVVRKIRWGWSVNGRWCPTPAVRDHQIVRLGGRPL